MSQTNQFTGVTIDMRDVERRFIPITWAQLRELGLGERVNVIGATETVRGVTHLEVDARHPQVYCDRAIDGPHRIERVS